MDNVETEIKSKYKEMVEKRESVLKYAKAMTNVPLDAIVSKNQKNKMIQKYSREQIRNWLENPSKNEAKLREVVDYLTSISPQFRRLLEYIPNMSYIVPFVKQRKSKFSEKKNKKNDFVKMCEKYEKLNIKKTSSKVMYEVIKYGIYNGIKMEGAYSNYNKRLNPDLCKIIMEGEKGYTIAYDFASFNGNEYLLDNGYPSCFRELYNIYKSGFKTLEGMGLSANWQPIPQEITLVIKYDTTTVYSVPPYVNAFAALYDLEEYQTLNKAKATAENYTLIGLKIPMLKDGQADDFAVSDDYIEGTTDMLDQSLPEYMGYFTTPTDIEVVRASSGSDNKIDVVANAIKNVWNSGGYAETMFGVDSTNSGTLEYSVKTDEQQLFRLYEQLETYWDYELKSLCGDKYKLTLLKISWFSVFDWIDKYLSSAQASIPVGIIIPLLLGYEISDIEDMVAMENEIYDIHNTWKPLASSHTTSEKAGRPQLDGKDLSASGEQTRINDSNNK